MAATREQRKAYRLRVRLDVLRHYSTRKDKKPHCACPNCRITEPAFLQIDHINGAGTKHRRDEPAARHIYSWLKAHGYPKGFRVLCANCNAALRSLDYCPHEKKHKKKSKKAKC